MATLYIVLCAILRITYRRKSLGSSITGRLLLEHFKTCLEMESVEMYKELEEQSELVSIWTWGCWLKKTTKNNSGSNQENQVIVIMLIMSVTLSTIICQMFDVYYF